MHEQQLREEITRLHNLIAEIKQEYEKDRM